MDFPHLLLHGLAGLWPSVGLVALTLFSWALRRPAMAPKMGWWGAALVLGAGALAVQGVALWCLRWPDGSMATYGALIVALATLRALLTRPLTRLS